jgi:hypothetical protein
MKGKLTPRYIGPFPILERCGNVANKLEFPPSLAGVHVIAKEVFKGIHGYCITESGTT